MISSIVWIYLYLTGVINPDHAPWKVYLPVVTVELIIYRFALPKLCDWFDKRKQSTNIKE